MFPRVSGVRHNNDYELEISFSDGTVTSLDFRKRIVGRGGVFTSLENIDFFSQVAVTLAWPNGVDFCPDVLYAEATGKSIEELGNGLEVA